MSFDLAAAAQELVRRTTAAQDLPEWVDDPATLATVAGVVSCRAPNAPPASQGAPGSEVA